MREEIGETYGGNSDIRTNFSVTRLGLSFGTSILSWMDREKQEEEG